jgi:hypothetical protein
MIEPQGGVQLSWGVQLSCDVSQTLADAPDVNLISIY